MMGFGTAKSGVEVHFEDCFYKRLLRKRCFDIVVILFLLTCFQNIYPFSASVLRVQVMAVKYLKYLCVYQDLVIYISVCHLHTTSVFVFRIGNNLFCYI